MTIAGNSLAIGITTDVVMLEMALLVRLKLAQVLDIPLGSTLCSIDYDGSKVIPEISVDPSKVSDLSDDEVIGIIRGSWMAVKPILEDRLLGLRETRID